ncbi:acyl-ACP--UDP-N-acetylglucosamine O-acyltransferase [Bartonella tamiae]|uniref:Acyl-[acyl-carrier-protein]--UDP-N-acetylglucosamine O-acyltransferase n=1 Tax=Bartonella tamiae Th239 TaxID=1094558 RepID=J0QS12_9HYPH|nr:acyl-ACP--UDP-N-acetylglucosamine O-acyltransferase [Bartonella tamiae]EJF88636.1 acyl-[acyl-carrier-protein]-UDP-N-acetylglucosamine O-acyltransferase [Bartonella tamiae Th239]EJF95114.1 acyl-[acyl-carrier-protein]-UDP-N-acetylglucosamine O-acyltransferase [Bartonella tamiae Th307]
MSNVKIHPTALVEEGAQLGQNVDIGPFCHISGAAVIGDNCRLMSHVVIMGATSLGADSIVYPHAILGCDPQNNKHKGGHTTLVIGKNCIIREGVTMHRGSDSSAKTTIVGDHCVFLAYAHVAHDCVLGNHVTFSNNVMIGGHVTIGDHVIIGGGGAVHQFCRVGHHAFVGGLAALVGDLIPYGSAIGVHAYLGGLNIIGMKRSGLKRQEIHAVRHAVNMLFDRTKPVRERAVDAQNAYSQSAAVADIISFIQEDHKRAYCTPKLLGLDG